MTRAVPWLLALVLVSGCAAPASSLRAGHAVVDLTPDWPVALGGYGARLGRLSTGVRDRVEARALYLESDGCRVALVTTDLIGSLLHLREGVRRELPPDLHVILTASHTHSAPSALIETREPLLVATVGRHDPRLEEWIRTRLVAVVRDAMRAPREVSVSRGSCPLPEFSKSRRSEHYEQGRAPLDGTLSVLAVGPARIVNYPAHPTVFGAGNLRISADWPGAMVRDLAARGIFALYTNGAEGDVSPRAPGGTDEQDRCARLGVALAGAVASLPLDAIAAPVALDYVERAIDLPQPSLRSWTRKSVVGALRLGDVALVCVPGELSVELGEEVKRRFRRRGFRDVWILGLANDHLFYMLSEEQYGKGGYERTMSFYGPAFGPWMVEQLDGLGEGWPVPRRE